MIYDYSKIRKEYKKLKCPKDVYNPCTAPLGVCAYHIILSDRSRGKTTNVLLLGMIFNKIYGTTIEYLRQRKEQIMPKFVLSLFNTIIEFKYIEKITDGVYNTVKYKSRRGYYAHMNESGEVDKIDETPFIHFAGLDEDMDLKSTYNSPNSDFIIFDEFIGKYYYKDECIDFLDILSTYLRLRTCVNIFMLANTIDKNSPYFDELCIRNEIDRISMNENTIVKTPLGTQLYIEILSSIANDKKKTVNAFLFGFNNPKLSSITGNESWAMPEYQHIPKNGNGEILFRGIYVEHAGKIIGIDIINHESIGICAYCHKSTKTYNDSIIYTAGNIPDKRYKYKFGDNDNISKTLWKKLYNRNLFYYADNTTGALIESYVNYCLKL